MTDFRGSGLLGLRHLWQFNIADSRAEKVFKVGTGQKTWYFFAATGINISGKVIEFIEEGKCDKYFYEQNEEINFYLFTQKLYNEFFYEFNELWIERGYTDFMKVNSTLEEFMMLKADNIFHKLIVVTIAINTVFQFISIFTGWVFYVDETNHYSHGRFYFIYVFFYLSIIILSIVQFAIYGKKFRRQNIFSLYCIVMFTIVGIAMQELLGGEVRTAYISLTIGFALLFIHYSEFSQLAADDKIHEQMIQITVDPLTGISNRYAYAQALKDIDKEELAKNTVVFSIDINSLKKINDTLGHSAGDELICAAADLISTVFMEYGICYRTGGDEFVVLTKMEKDMIDVLISQLEEKTSVWHGKSVSDLSLSIGSACISDNPEISIENLINIADKEMYKAKLAYYISTGNERRKI